MERRKLLATAGAVSLTAAAAVVAVGASFGVFGLADSTTRVGRLEPVVRATPAPAPAPQVVYVDAPPETAPRGAPAASPTRGDTRSEAQSETEVLDSSATEPATVAPAPEPEPTPATAPATTAHEREQEHEHDDD